MKMVYRAIDGSIFEDMEQCVAYEDALAFEPLEDSRSIGSFRIGRLSEVLNRISAREEVRMQYEDRTVKLIPAHEARGIQVVGAPQDVNRDTIYRVLLTSPNIRLLVRKRDGNGRVN